MYIRSFPEGKLRRGTKLIAIAFGRHLSGGETQKMLKISGKREFTEEDAYL
jgi:hypothetical protein